MMSKEQAQNTHARHTLTKNKMQEEEQ